MAVCITLWMSDNTDSAPSKHLWNLWIHPGPWSSFDHGIQQCLGATSIKIVGMVITRNLRCSKIQFRKTMVSQQLSQVEPLLETKLDNKPDNSCSPFDSTDTMRTYKYQIARQKTTTDVSVIQIISFGIIHSMTNVWIPVWSCLSSECREYKSVTEFTSLESSNKNTLSSDDKRWKTYL